MGVVITVSLFLSRLVGQFVFNPIILLHWVFFAIYIECDKVYIEWCRYVYGGSRGFNTHTMKHLNLI